MANIESSLIALIGVICLVVSVYLVKSERVKKDDISVSDKRVAIWLTCIAIIVTLSAVL